MIRPREAPPDHARDRDPHEGRGWDDGRVVQENMVVVPTGFEPVFKDDYDFALYLHELR